MGRRKPRYFLLVYYDDDTKTFNVGNPITDDTLVIERTVTLQKLGRNVRISTAGNPETDINKVPDPKDYINRGPSGYKYDPNLNW